MIKPDTNAAYGLHPRGHLLSVLSTPFAPPGEERREVDTTTSLVADLILTRSTTCPSPRLVMVKMSCCRRDFDGECVNIKKRRRNNVTQSIQRRRGIRYRKYI